MKTLHKLVSRGKELQLNRDWKFIYVKQELWKALDDYTNL